MFGHMPELELLDPLDPLELELDDGVVVVVELMLPDDVVVVAEEEPVAACVIAAAPPASVPVIASVASTFRKDPSIWVSLLSIRGVGLQ
jgi:hypothetical protein